MSAPDPARPPGPPLLVVIDPAARLSDGESVRIARDVLCAGAPGVKVCVPETVEETARALARRGRRRPVVIGDDRALLRAVQFLHGDRGLGEAVLSVVPVGSAHSVTLARGLGVPPDAVAAARAALGGAEHRLDLLVDDSGGVVLGGLRIPDTGAAAGAGLLSSLAAPLSSCVPLRRAYRALTGTARAARPGTGEERVRPLQQRLRVEADGELLVDWDRPVEEVSVHTGDAGFADVTVRARASGVVVGQARAREVTVAGPEFRYRAGVTECGLVRGTRTWTVAPSALRLMVPAQRSD